MVSRAAQTHLAGRVFETPDLPYSIHYDRVRIEDELIQKYRIKNTNTNTNTKTQN